MMTQFVSLLTKVTAAVVVLAGLAMAQPMSDVVKVHVPYSMEINGSNLPAGDYEVSVLPVGGGMPVLLLRNGDAVITVNATREPSMDGEVSGKTEMTLSKTGNVYRPIRVSIAGRAYSYRID